MRDERGYYRDTKPLEELVPEWAHGCENCQYGIVQALPLTGATELHLERLVQAIDKQLVFCTCKAGTRYRSFLLNRRQFLLEEARRSPRMGQAAARASHPDIDIARQRIHKSYETAEPPTIHYEGERVTA